MTGSYKHANKTSAAQQRYYTPEFIVQDAIRALQTHLPGTTTHMLDMGAGDGRFGDALNAAFAHMSILSIDLVPQWRTPSSTNHSKVQADALVYTLPGTIDANHTVAGFNPPYGLRNKLAKSFVQRAYALKCGHVCWLVPRVLVPFLAQYYHVMHRKDYHRLTLFCYETKKTQGPQWVTLIIGKRRPKPIVPRNTLKGGYSRAIFTDATNLIVRIIGGKVPFPLFLKRGESWWMYDYQNDKVRQHDRLRPLCIRETLVTCTFRPASKSYGAAKMHAVMETSNNTTYVVGGHAFAKLSVAPIHADWLLHRLSGMAKEHVFKLKLRREKRFHLRHLDPVPRYYQMNAIYNDQSAIETFYTSYHPCTWSPETLVYLMHGKTSTYVCYLLASGNRTYIGITNHLSRRIRQHNGELAGGAKYTRGKQWRVVCYVGYFSTKQEAMRFEWRYKRAGKGLTARKGRALGHMLGGSCYGLIMN